MTTAYSLPTYLTVTADGVYHLARTTYGHPTIMFSIDGTFGGASIEIGRIHDTDTTNGIAEEGLFYKLSDIPITTSNKQYISTIGYDSPVAFRVSGATATTCITVSTHPIAKKQ